jgi:hypothetical protein
MRLFLILAPVILSAQPQLTCDTPEHRQFDFWIGEWSVSSGAKPVGHSVITKELAGCLIVENWYGSDGDRAKSLNWYESATKKWRRIYVGLKTSADCKGEWNEGSLRFEGMDSTRLIFTPATNKSVRRQKERFENGRPITIEDFVYKPERITVQESSSKLGCTSPQSRQFDFWVGNWNVYNPANQLAGTNRIDKTVNGCLLVENWKGAKAGAGKSFNFYDARLNKWRQVWVSAEGSLDLQGDLIDGSMRYTGETTGLNGVSQESIVFTPNSDGTVRQLWQQSPDGGNTWRVNFDGLYRSAP